MPTIAIGSRFRPSSSRKRRFDLRRSVVARRRYSRSRVSSTIRLELLVQNREELIVGRGLQAGVLISVFPIESIAGWPQERLQVLFERSETTFDPTPGVVVVSDRAEDGLELVKLLRESVPRAVCCHLRT